MRSGDYYLFETDSEEEDEEEKKDVKKKKEEEPPEKSAFQVSEENIDHVSMQKTDRTTSSLSFTVHQFVYHAWITDSRTAMRARYKQRKNLERTRKESKEDKRGGEKGRGRRKWKRVTLVSSLKYRLSSP